MVQSFFHAFDQGAQSKCTKYSSAALVASAVIKALPGTVVGVTVINNNASTRWLHLFNSATVPADTSVPDLIIQVGGNAQESLDLSSMNGDVFSAGISVANSTTLATKTLGSADLFITVWYV